MHRKGYTELVDIGQTECVSNSKRNSLKNFLSLSLCYFLLYTGFWGLTNLQSTMNAASGIGVSSQAVFYAFAMASSLLLPQLSIEKCGCKSVLITGSMVCCLYIVSNIRLRLDTMMISSIVFGLSTGPFIASQSLYVNEMAKRFHAAVGGKLENVMALFFGCYAIARSGSQIMGNVISYLVLRTGQGVVRTQNGSLEHKCGVNFQIAGAESGASAILDPPSDHERIVLIEVFALMGSIATILMIFFLDPLPKTTKKGYGCSVVGQQILAALQHLRKPHQMLLIPMSILIGLEISFYTTEFTSVSTHLGIMNWKALNTTESSP
ncbi:hypothetical protein JTE90_013430 [Oedothorax gibbosus]|uniref:Uncharacterized protein n=1 Tax=Oedothorax gibbosus TaxID=931172 RepID=A0AAV6UH59_9ARAC|nr:hypothetical protein JTE90_013430 [Oedothorax gibbosus]